ncbi:hypothetical protein [Pseudomonas sp. RL_35y_Pfl2_P42]|uniref:hypothetical protein n=1 Tax=Pseudomonas sp. RL_35y_Pfl2_P42 TaxID=3088710 RepID=UPI0030DD098C
MSDKFGNSTVGDLDPDFGPDGTGISWLEYPDGDNGFASGITVTPDHKLLIAARSGQKYSIVRLTADGKQDDSFGNRGTVTGMFASGFKSTGKSIRVLKDQRILLDGLFDLEEFGAPPVRGLALYDDKGALVSAFGEGGVTVVHPITSPQYALSEEEKKQKGPSASSQNGNSIELPDGKLMVLSNHSYSFADQIGLLMRLNPNGSLDTTFGDGKGYVPIQYLANSTWAGSLLHLQDGTFAVAGSAHVEGTSFAMIARFDAQGIPVRNFGRNGFVLFDFQNPSSEITELVQMPDGNILGMGSTGQTGIFSGVMVCIDSKGAFAGSFNGGNPLLTPFPQAPLGIQWISGAQRDDNKIVVIANTLGESNSKLLLAQFHPTGEPDLGFGNQGKLMIDLTDVLDMANGIAIQKGQIVVSGTSLPHPQGVCSFALRCSAAH